MNDEVKKIRAALSAFAFIVHRSSFIVLLFFLPGCSLVGAVAQKASGGIPIAAKYVPNKLEPMVVLAENWNNPSDSDVETEQLARFAYDELKDHKVAPQIDPMRVIDLRTDDPVKFRTMSIPQIGRWVGARRVLYINIIDDTLNAPIGSKEVSGGCTARVKMVNVASGQTEWPPDEADGYPISVQTSDIQQLPTDTDEASIRQALDRVLAERIVRLFYKHDVEDDEAGADTME